MATANNITAPSDEAKASLIFPSGALNGAAIGAEIARRMLNTTPWMRECVEKTVRKEALKERQPFLDRAICAEWTDAEDKEYWALRDAAFGRPISARGNADYTQIMAAAAAISDAVHARALAKIESDAVEFAIAA